MAQVLIYLANSDKSSENDSWRDLNYQPAHGTIPQEQEQGGVG